MRFSAPHFAHLLSIRALLNGDGSALQGLFHQAFIRGPTKPRTAVRPSCLRPSMGWGLGANAGQWTTLNRAEEAHGLSFSSLVPNGWEISRVGFPLRRHLDLRSHESPQSTVPLKKVFRLTFVVEGVGYRWCGDQKRGVRAGPPLPATPGAIRGFISNRPSRCSFLRASLTVSAFLSFACRIEHFSPQLRMSESCKIAQSLS